MYWSLGVSGGVEDGDSATMRSDREIAGDWLYGDLIHADPQRRQKIRHIPDHYKLLAGLLWVKDSILMVRATQQVIIDLQNQNELRAPS
jgi:hypothetical protein